jgi:hypothetical protein
VAAAFIRVLDALGETDEAQQRLDTLLMFFSDEPEVQLLMEELRRGNDETGG